MNNYLFAAGVLAILLGIVHSALGEVLVFRKLRVKNTLTWISDINVLPLRAIRILWASWHIVTLFGFSFGAILISFSFAVEYSIDTDFILNSIAISTFLSALIVLLGTRAKHPGWSVLLGICVLIGLG